MLCLCVVAGTPADPGLMVLSLSQIFQEKAAQADAGEEFTVTCSYLEVYNEVRWGIGTKNIMVANCSRALPTMRCASCDALQS